MTPCGVGGRSRNPSATRIKGHKWHLGSRWKYAGGYGIGPTKTFPIKVVSFVMVKAMAGKIVG